MCSKAASAWPSACSSWPNKPSSGRARQAAAALELEELAPAAWMPKNRPATGRPSARVQAERLPGSGRGLLHGPSAGQKPAPAGGAGAATHPGTGGRAAQPARTKPPARKPPGALCGPSAKPWSARYLAQIQAVQEQHALTQEAAELAEAAHQQLQDSLPTLEEARRSSQQARKRMKTPAMPTVALLQALQACKKS